VDPAAARIYATGITDQAAAAVEAGDRDALIALIERVMTEQGPEAAAVLAEWILAHVHRKT
jgi:hypothetical protein